MEITSIKELEYKIKDTEVMIKVGKRDLREYKRKLKEIRDNLKRMCHSSFFELVDSTPCSDVAAEMNVIVRKSNNGELREKWAKHWSIWRHFDDEGNTLMVWQGPCQTGRQEYPDAVKSRFIGYRVRYRPQGAGVATTLLNFEDELERYVEGERLHGVKIDRSFKNPAIRSHEEVWARARGRLGMTRREHPDRFYDTDGQEYYNLCVGCGAEMKEDKYFRMPEDGLGDCCKNVDFVKGDE